MNKDRAELIADLDNTARDVDTFGGNSTERVIRRAIKALEDEPFDVLAMLFSI